MGGGGGVGSQRQYGWSLHNLTDLGGAMGDGSPISLLTFSNGRKHRLA